MTRFQAIFIYYLREKCDCSWRALAAHFYNRYNYDWTNKLKSEIQTFDICTIGGNQIEGMLLHEESMKLLNIRYE